MGGRLNLSASNPVKDAIDAYGAISANYRADEATALAAKKDERDAAAAGLQNQVAQNALTDHSNKKADQQLSAISMKVQSGVALTPAEQAVVDSKAPVEQGTPVQTSAVPMPADTRLAQAKSMAPSPMWVAPAEMTAAQEADRNVLIGTFDKMNQNPKYVPTLDEYKMIAREVVNNPAMQDHSIGEQYQSLSTVNEMVGHLQGIKQPTVITDPKALAAISASFPKFAAQSNLKNAQISKIYVEPSPDGDPMKAQLVIGLTGQNEQGATVDGVVTSNRSSDPGDQVVRLTSGELSSQAKQKTMLLNGLRAAQVEYGNKEVMPIFEAAQANRATAQAMITQAATMEEGTSKKELLMEAALLTQGKIPAIQAAAIANKFYAPIHKAEGAKASHDQAIEMKKMDKEAQLAVADKHAESSRYTADKHLEGVKMSADAKERGDDKRQTRTERRDDSKETTALIAANTKLRTAVTTKTGTMTTIDPLTQQPVTKTYVLDPAAIKAAEADILANNQRIDVLRGDKPREAPPVADSAPPPQSTGKGAAFASKYK